MGGSQGHQLVTRVSAEGGGGGDKEPWLQWSLKPRAGQQQKGQWSQSLGVEARDAHTFSLKWGLLQTGTHAEKSRQGMHLECFHQLMREHR